LAGREAFRQSSLNNFGDVLEDDRDTLKELESKIKVEAGKTDDIYSMIEKEQLQNMKIECLVDDEHITLMKYIRKNLKIIGRLEDIAEKLLFARLGGES
jgi:hypothetical protein